ncbi:hypothetical protein ACLB2K_047180 [Fragaria x ananassa]
MPHTTRLQSKQLPTPPPSQAAPRSRPVPPVTKAVSVRHRHVVSLAVGKHLVCAFLSLSAKFQILLHSNSKSSSAIFPQSLNFIISHITLFLLHFKQGYS